MSDEIEGARTLPVRFRDLSGNGSSVAEVIAPPAKPGGIRLSTVVGLTPVMIAAANPGRICLTGVNAGPGYIWVGDDVDVTVADGIPVPPGAPFEERDTTGALYAVSDTDGNDVRTRDV